MTFFVFFSLFLSITYGYDELSENYKIRPYEYESSYWHENARKTLLAKQKYKVNNNRAKNVIIFIGDGMSLTTVAATRSFQGNEATPLSFETFPVIGMSKTYCVNTKVADSACSATAYLSGVKGNIETIGVNAKVEKFDCDAMRNKSNQVDSIAKWFQDEGCGSGVLTTTRITHASPSGVHAHTAYRFWENDANVADSGLDPEKCHDIARQLVYGETGRNLNVIMGGGASNFLPESEGGSRRDGRNLIEAWKLDKIKRNKTFAYVTNKKELDELMSKKIYPQYVLGLFNMSHMSYFSENNKNQPTLAEMTTAAMKILSGRNKCYFLMSEGGKIDMAHHENKANNAMIETKELSDAVEKARSASSEKDTLIMVTSDHGHAMSFSGYGKREGSITGFAGVDINGRPYRTLSYATGPGFRNKDGDPTLENSDDPDFMYEALVPSFIASHDGTDVCVYCSGPGEHMCRGSNEQSYYPHAAAWAACVGKGPTMCDNSKP